MIQITISLSDEDWAAIERDADREEEPPVFYVSAELCNLAGRIRAREAVARSDEPCEWLR
jgi:hypothetical protein